jgi:hypothetical protein
MSENLTPDPNRYTPPVPVGGAATGKAPVLSIISLVAGIVGVLSSLIGVGLLFAIGAVVLGHLGRRKEPEARGFWITGLVTGYAGMAISLLVIVIGVITVIGLINMPGNGG